MLSWLARPRVASLAVVVSVVAGVTSEMQLSLRSMVGKTMQGRVTSVIDGDTVEVHLADGASVRVRLEGIDAPEAGAPYGDEARSATQAALFGQAVSVRATDVDHYGRLVARVSANGRDSSLDLVRAGLACHYTRHSNDSTLAAAQKHARAAVVGFWAAGARRPSACSAPQSSSSLSARTAVSNQSRHVERVIAEPVVYHGNRRSRVYHRPSCRNYSCPNCVIAFDSQEEARAAGFRPAGDCFDR
jgi:endonuclease YncB( thermonuclease family)